ncbi:hypothetical protein AOL_s00110g110 [Orbilia oligospora ATCC 24927]|uniref:Uncharacterized protein n=1 Tax=Arthrobotrys oligospora (strain ATCC 24927 / CBS 115.81 / DSM 1491) TaxID=756982 RepID=G1XKU0_ARTOA|nr:hypothetical protein AOL_s00110g110 [Orbilia oligospora ATCC 24927]EGX46286.1 hypothetical protein AOL_s00110g110 [Orbilia oligospora ATCC 24927]
MLCEINCLHLNFRSYLALNLMKRRDEPITYENRRIKTTARGDMVSKEVKLGVDELPDATDYSSIRTLVDANSGVDVLAAERTEILISIGIDISESCVFSNLRSVYDDVLQDALDGVWTFYSVKVKSMEDPILSCKPRSRKVFLVIMESLNDGRMAIGFDPEVLVGQALR